MEAIKLPFIALNGQSFILFPKQSNSIDLTRQLSLSTLKESVEVGNHVVIGFFRNPEVPHISRVNIWDVGCEAIVKSISPLQGESKRIFVEGVRRVLVCNVSVRNGSVSCACIPIEEPKFEMTEYLGEMAMDIQNQALSLESTSTFAPMMRPKYDHEFGNFIDAVANRISLDGNGKILMLRESDVKKRAEMLRMHIAGLVLRESERMAEQAAKDVKESTNTQPENPTTEKQVILDPKNLEIKRLRRLIGEAGMPDEARNVALNELSRLQMMSPSTADFSLTVTYLDVMASLPWNKASTDKADIKEAARILDEDHYGLKVPKERILEFLAVRQLTGKSGGAILCFVGPPGVGKTSLGQSIARAMGRIFIRTSLGGMRDEAEMRGHRRTYIGALPGRILQEMRKAKVKNPVFMLDEIDKLMRDNHGDPAAALLEILDPEQNHSFKDNYLDIPFDLSQVFFISTANDAHLLPPALRDRLDIVELPGYSLFDKVRIARKHLVPKQKTKNGLTNHNVDISDDGLVRIVEAYTNEAGVRNLERHCGSVFRKLAVDAAAGQSLSVSVDQQMVSRLLGPPKLFAERMAKESAVGISTGLAWSSCGGSILFVESVEVPGGGGKIELMTGNLGQVLQESAKIAHTWIKSNASAIGIPDDVATKTSIHVHIPSGSTPKDGPSAGVALVVSVASLLSKLPVRNDIAMTGEISLRGRVMPVGGVVEKLLAAHRSGIREVMIPKANEDSLMDVPKEVLEEMKIHLIDHLAEALDIALVGRKT